MPTPPPEILRLTAEQRLQDASWTATDLDLTIGRGERRVAAPAPTLELTALISGRRALPAR